MTSERQNVQLFRRAQALTPGGVHSPVRAFGAVGGTPFFTERAQGACLYEREGRKLLDFCMSFGPLPLGHAHPAVVEAAREAIADGWSFGTAERYSLELSEFIIDRVPWVQSLRFVNSGTEAVMTALRLARGATGRQRLLKFAGCYHGHVDSMLIRAGSGMATLGVADSAGVSPGVAQDTVVAALDDESGLDAAFRLHGKQLAAAIIEPLPANHGLLPQRLQFLERLRRVCSEHGTLLIFDEVISGFRLAFGGFAEASGITPDLVTWGKVIGGGFPVGAIAGARELLELLAPTGPVYQAGTLSANPVAMRAGLATLREMCRTGAWTRLEELGARLESRLGEAGFFVQRAGSIFWLPGLRGHRDAVRAPAQIDAGLVGRYPQLFHALLDRQIYLAPSACEVGFLSTAHTHADIDRLTEALRAC